MVKNGNDLVPCHCDKCKGVPRNRRTERAHRAARRKQETEAQAGTSRFSEWYQAQGQRFATAKTGSPDLEEEELSSDSSLSNTRDSEGSKRPKKRPRVLESAVSRDDIENSDLEDPLGFDVEVTKACSILVKRYSCILGLRQQQRSTTLPRRHTVGKRLR
ncbi:hypothetical protein JOM56_013539 [Amanita muscaria]